MARLVQCMTCLTLDKIPDCPPHIRPEDDVLLDGVCERHKFPNGDPHIGNLLSVDDATWANLEARTQIEKEVWKDQVELAATRDTYAEDALVCFNSHRRPHFCIDWMDSKKRLGNPTKEGWKSGRVKVFLCHFCPVMSNVQTEVNYKKGLYK